MPDERKGISVYFSDANLIKHLLKKMKVTYVPEHRGVYVVYIAVFRCITTMIKVVDCLFTHYKATELSAMQSKDRLSV